jgi:hypothetical protein
MDSLAIIVSFQGSLVIALLIIQVKRQGTLERHFTNLTADLNKAVTNLTQKLTEYILSSSKEYVTRSDCRAVRDDCREHVSDGLIQPIIDKIDKLAEQRSDAWATQKAVNENLWDRTNKHSHTGLPEGSKVIV